MRLCIISGTSGAGKSVALHALEDIGFYCIDNLPLALLPAFAHEVLVTEKRHYDSAAVGIDARNLAADLSDFPRMLAQLKESGIETQVIFLNADDATLIRRFKETRRRHPLLDDGQPLVEAIGRERRWLEPIMSRADLIIDTTRTNVHQLRTRIQGQVGQQSGQGIALLFQSFGYKHGVPVDADFVFDVRCLPNPYWEPRLRDLTGRDREVALFLEEHAEVDRMYAQVRDLLGEWLPHFCADNRACLAVAIGCTGGQHRSVYFAERLARHFRENHYKTLTQHRELP